MAKKTGGRYPKSKGNAYENKIAKKLDAWLRKALPFFRNVSRPLFSRVPRSGAWRKDTPLGLEDKVVGDIVTPASFPFVIEAKNQKTWSFPSWMREIRGEIEDAESTKPWAIIVHEHNTSNEFIFIDFDLFMDLVDATRMISSEEIIDLQNRSKPKD